MPLKLEAKVVLPLAVLSIGLAVMILLVSTRPSAKSQRPPEVVPPVETVRAMPESLEHWVSAQGTVEPRTESDLVAEVSGRVVWLSPDAASGGFFEAGAVLARIDRRDYDVALEAAHASLARARGDHAHAEATLRRQRAMLERGAASEARLDEAVHNLATADASVREARAALQRAELDLERTSIVAPFAGRVREKLADVGQFLARGAPVARVYSVDYAEVRLPITDRDLAYLDLPLRFRERAEPGATATAPPQLEGPEVILSASFAGAHHTWRGRVARVEGALDAQSRMLGVVARVDDPYGRHDDPDRPPLPIGLFVDAKIRGRIEEGLFGVPRSALRRRDEVLVVGPGDRLSLRRVEVVRTTEERCWIRSGLSPGERVVVTALDVATEGMAVRPIPETRETRATDTAEATSR